MTTMRSIDELAISLDRDVLFLTFHTTERTLENLEKYNLTEEHLLDCWWIWQDEIQVSAPNPNKQIILDWLTENNIPFEICSGISAPPGFSPVVDHVYLDFPYDDTNPLYQQFAEFYQESERGWSSKFEGVRYFLLPITVIKLMQETINETYKKEE